jgi:hypothetical protein
MLDADALVETAMAETSLSDFGLSARAVRDTFRSYTERFAVDTPGPGPGHR